MTFDASRHVVLPGLVNAHHHFYQTLTRAHPAGHGKELIAWLVAMEQVWGRMTPEALRIAVRMALVELMLSGCATTADHHNLFPPGLEGAIDIEVDEARKLGMRLTATRGSMGSRKRTAACSRTDIVQDSDAILEDSERVLRLFHDPNPGAMIRVALAPCSPLAVPQRVMTDRRNSPSATMRVSIATSASRATRMSTASRRSACARSIFWRRPAGSAPGPGSRTAFISTPTKSNAWPGRRRGQPLRRRRHALRRRHLSDPGSRGGGRSDRHRRRRLGVERFLQPDGGRSPFADAAALRYGPGVTPLDALRWATEGRRRASAAATSAASRPGMQADLALYTLGRAALHRRAGSDRGARALRRASRRPGDGRRPLAGDRRTARRGRSRSADRPLPDGRARLRLKRSRAPGFDFLGIFQDALRLPRNLVWILLNSLGIPSFEMRDFNGLRAASDIEYLPAPLPLAQPSSVGLSAATSATVTTAEGS